MDDPLTVTPFAPLTDGEVLLRLADPSDIAAIVAYGQDPDVEETGWLPIHVPCSHEVAARVVEEFQRGWQGRFGVTLIITVPPATDMRGVVHLFLPTAGVGEIAYGVAPQHRRRGLATRATRLVADWAVAQLDCSRVEIVITARAIYGLASQRVAEKAGFVRDGVRRSHVPATGREYEDALYTMVARTLPPRERTDTAGAPPR